MTMPPDVAQQARNALATIARTLQQAGFGMDDVVRARYIVTTAPMSPRSLPCWHRCLPISAPPPP